MTHWPCILIVESKGHQVAQMRQRLRERFPTGFVAAVGKGADAEQLDLTRFDLLLLGYHLPDCTGLELLTRLVPRVTVPILMVTGLRSGDAAASAIHAGASDYLVKTDDYLELLPIVVEKNLVMASLRANVGRLQEELCRRCDELREKNAQLEQRNGQLREAALRDPLTGLYNRRYVNEAIEQLVSGSLRYREDLACMMIDLDRFKKANDELGHLVGDRLLRLAGQVITDSIRGSDVAARFGGDEFVILLPKSTFADAYACAERIDERFRETVAGTVPMAADMTLSIGIATVHRGDCRSARALVAAADQAMYASKANGGGGIHPTPSVPVF